MDVQWREKMAEQKLSVSSDALMRELRRKLLPSAPRDDYGSETEKLAQLLETLARECTGQEFDFEITLS